MMKQGAGRKTVGYVVLGILLLVVLFPVYWMVNTSFKTDMEIYLRNPTFFPQNIVTSGYTRLFSDTPFVVSMTNSVIVALAVSAITVFFSMLASYSIARLRIRGGRAMSNCILYTYLMPRNLLFIPLYILLSKMGLAGSRSGLILLYPTFTIPYAMWMMIAYFKSVPKEMEESAMVDGCGHWKTMFRIFFPLAMPGIVSTFIFCFTLSWNEYLYAFVMITDSAAKTFPLMLSDLMVDDVYAWGPLMAGSVLSCLPILLIYMLASTKVTGGITAGAVKQ
ncbi:MAG: carbohydrate ABC transporter permease [Clostridia bacterium]